MKQRADGRWRKTKIINGKTVAFYSKAKTEKAALRDIEKQMIDYVEKAVKNKSFEEIAEEWKGEHLERVSWKTWSGYQAHYNRALAEFGKYKFEEIEIPDVQIYVNKLANQKYAYKTVRHAVNILSQIFDFAILKKQISVNPCQYIKIPQGLERKQRELPNQQEIDKVINGVNCHFGEFAYLLLFTGLRRGEALALRSEHIDFENKIINVKQAITFKSNHPEIKEPKTKAGYRQVFLLDCLIPILKSKEGFIFGGKSPMTEQAFRRAWQRYCKQSGVTITPHQLRHAYATILYENGIEEKSAQRLLGHSDYKTTVEIYTHISESKNQKDFQKLNEWSSKQIEKKVN